MKLRIQVEGRAYELDVGTFQPRRNDAFRPRPAELELPAAVTRPRPPQRLPEDSVCRAPVAGRVVAVFGVEGKAVRRNEPVVLIEAMKMEIPIGPAVDGTVKSIHVSVGDLIVARQVIFELC
jgi:biotin carboxyl carrier protein